MEGHMTTSTPSLPRCFMEGHMIFSMMSSLDHPIGQPLPADDLLMYHKNDPLITNQFPLLVKFCQEMRHSNLESTGTICISNHARCRKG